MNRFAAIGAALAALKEWVKRSVGPETNSS